MKEKDAYLSQLEDSKLETEQITKSLLNKKYDIKIIKTFVYRDKTAKILPNLIFMKVIQLTGYYQTFCLSRENIWLAFSAH